MSDSSAPVNTRAGRDLPAAITVGVIALAAVVASLLWWDWGFVLIVAAVTVGASIELHRALSEKLQAVSSIIPIVIGDIAIVVGSYLAAARPGRLPSTTVLLAAIGFAVVAALVWRMPKGSAGYVKDAAASLFIIAYVSVLGSFISLMLGAPDGPARIAAFLLCVVASDTGGYIAGVLFGKHPLAPAISPKKSWEGLAGSFALSLTVGALMSVYALRAPFWVGLILGACMVVFGTMGDLVESLIKRDLGLKDMSHFVPGHGGIMDRVDSIVLAAPVAWFVLFLLVPQNV